MRIGQVWLSRVEARAQGLPSRERAGDIGTTVGALPMRSVIAAALMTPADRAIQEPDAPFSVRRRQRGGRRDVAVSSSVSAVDALRSRIRAQSKTVADHIATDAEAKAFIDDWATPEPITR